MGAEFVVVVNKLPEFAAALDGVFSKLVYQTALDIAEYAGANHEYQNQTGFAASSYYAVSKDKSTYGQGLEGGADDVLPEIEHPTDNLTAYASSAAPYLLYLELGTSKMPAYPSLIPATEAIKGHLTDPQGLEGMLRIALGLPL